MLEQLDKVAKGLMMAKFGASLVVSLLLAAAVVYFLTDLKRDEDNSKRALFLLGPALGFSVMFNIGYGWCMARPLCARAGLVNTIAGSSIVYEP